jgi:hypothetical protein
VFWLPPDCTYIIYTQRGCLTLKKFKTDIIDSAVSYCDNTIWIKVYDLSFPSSGLITFSQCVTPITGTHSPHRLRTLTKIIACFCAACYQAATHAGLAAHCCISIRIWDTETTIQTTKSESAREEAKPQRFPVSCRNKFHASNKLMMLCFVHVVSRKSNP